MTWRRVALLALGLASGSFAATLTALVAVDYLRAYNQWRSHQ